MFNVDKLTQAQEATLVPLVQGMTTRSISTGADALNYLKDLIVHSRDAKYVIKRSAANKDKPNKLYLEFMDTMDIRPRDRGVHYQTMRKISDVLGGLSMFKTGITGNRNAELVLDIDGLAAKFNETMTYMADVLRGKKVEYIAFNLFLVGDVALGLLSFTWFDELSSDTQAELEDRRVSKK